MKTEKLIGVYFSIFGGLGFFLEVLTQTQGLILCLVGFVMIYVQRSKGSEA